MRNLWCVFALLLPACSDPNSSNGPSGSGGDGGSARSSIAGQSASGGASTASSASSGGTSSGGASTGTGGNTVGGASVISGECNLPAPSTTGVAKPSGTPGDISVVPWAGFKGAASYTFDDANTSQIEHYAELQALGVRMTFYLYTGKGAASNAIWAQAVKDGHELGNHTKSHAQTGTEADIDQATEFIKTKFGVTPYTMAAPYGDSSYVALAKPRFMINRGVSNALITPTSSANPFNLPCYIPPTGAKAAAFNSQMDSAASQGGWRVVLVHGFTGGTDGAYQPVDIAEFTAGVTYAKDLGLWVDSVVNVGAYWIAHKLLAATTPTTSGDEKTWTWTLPSNYPPGKCLRVQVPGGTVKQNGKALEWDDHGYYQIALDYGSVTVTP